MKFTLKPLSLLLALTFVAVTIGCGTANGQAIQASGQIEATEIAIAPELSGRIVEVNVKESDPVKAGDTLLRMDDSLLQLQRTAAEAKVALSKADSARAQNALQIAKAQYQSTLQDALAQDKTSRLGDWQSKNKIQFDQPNWYFTRAEQAQAAQLQVDQASQALEDAKAKLADITNGLDTSDFLAAEKRLLNARIAYEINKDVNKHAQNSDSANQPITDYNLKNCAKNEGYNFAKPGVMNQYVGCNADVNLTKKSEALFNAAKTELDQAQQAYDKLLTTQAARKVLQARADISVEQEKYYVALDRLRTLQTGDQSPTVTAAREAVDQAQATYDQSQDAIKGAQANLDVINEQIKKMTITSPVDGVVLVRSVQAGEVLQAGMTAMTIGQLSTLKVTVYIPEDQYGQISLGEKANLSVDSFPNQTFKAQVTRIADQAEYTPQNVQTKEGRQTTVYAVELSVDNPNGKLKPGMPTDVTFSGTK